MSQHNTASVDDLVWAREMLRKFSKLEKDLRIALGQFGIEKIVLKSPLFMALLLFSIIFFVFGVFLWTQEKNPIYLSSFFILPFSSFYILKTIKAEKNKNIFRFIGKSTIISVSTLELLLNIVEDAIFSEKEKFETIIAWRVNLSDSNDLKKYSHMFQSKTWEHIETAQEQCLVLAILMVSLQKFLHNNRDTYNEYVKKIPLMNSGYNYKPVKEQAKKLNPEDIQTFGFTNDN